MADPRFYDNAGPFELAEICRKVSVPLPAGANPEAVIFDLASLEAAGAGQLTYAATGKHAEALPKAAAAFCFVREGAEASGSPVAILCGDPVLAFARAAALFYPRAMSSGINHEDERFIDPLAVIAPSAIVAEGAVIGPGAEIGARTVIGPHAVIGRGVAIGADCRIGAHVSVTHALVGDRVVIHPGVRIGQDGFGYVPSASGHHKMPQLGRVIIQDEVEIGANCAIDRGALGDTVVGQGTKIDNLVQIAHNVRIGRHCIIVAQVGISGSCELGDFAILGGQAGLADHVRIGKAAKIAAQSGVTNDVPAGAVYAGYPARPAMQWRREAAILARMAKRKAGSDG